MINHKFIIINEPIEVIDIRNYDEIQMIRISHKFVLKHIGIFNRVRFQWSGYKTQRSGLSDGCTTISYHNAKKVKEGLESLNENGFNDDFENKEYYKLLDLVNRAIIEKKQIMHVAP